MTSRFIRAGALLLLLLSVAASASAQAVTVSGAVQTGLGVPVANTLVEFTQGASVIGSGMSGPDGSYSVVLTVGVYDLRVTPPGGSGFVPQSQNSLNFDSDETLDIILVAPALVEFYSGKVVTRTGAALSGATVELSGQDGAVEAVTNAAGEFEIESTATPGQSQFVQQFTQSSGSFWRIYFPDVNLSAGAVSGVTLTIEDRVLSGVMTGPDDQPVANVSVRWEQGVAYAGMGGSGGSGAQSAAVTNAQGQFSLLAFPGPGTLTFTPPQASDLKVGSRTVTIADQAADPPPVAIQLEGILRETYSGKVVDRAGIGVSGVTLELEGEDTTHQTTTDGSGDFVLQSTATPNQSLFAQKQTSSSFWRIYFPNVDLSSGPVPNDELAIEDRVLTGVVTAPNGQPVANVALRWEQDVYYNGIDRGFAQNAATTNAQGQFTLPVFPGAGDLTFTPPEIAALEAKVVAVVVPDTEADPSPMNVQLDALVRETYSGKVVNRTGVGVGGLTVELSGQDTTHQSVTDGQGNFSIQSTLTPGQTQFVQSSAQSGFWRVYFAPVDLSSGPVTGVTLTLQNRVLSGVVTDPDRRPVANVQIRWEQDVVYPGVVQGFSSQGATTNAQGAFTLAAFPGIGDLDASLTSGNRYAPFSVTDVEISEDQSFAILVQFSTDAVSGTVPAGGTVTSDNEGDGATDADPLESGIRLPAGGTATIQEHAVTTTPPPGVVFLTQQVSITAPPASTEMPLVATFVLDATRIPPGVAAADVQIFKNGVQVETCVGAAGIASPDPCVSSKTLLPGGDVQVTVLTSSASEWNIGVVDPNGPCGNSTLNASEECDDGNRDSGDCCSSTCTYETIGASCDDANLCTTGEACNGTGTCEPGTPVACSAMGECYQVGVCDPATGVCSNPLKSAGAPCGSSADDACTDPDSCNAAGVCVANDVAGCCLDVTTCDDGLDCTLDSCVSNACSHAPVASCCDINAQCNDDNACTMDQCDTASNSCSNTKIGGCCLVDADCDDHQACTQDSCDTSDRTCDHEEIDDCCTANSECDDQNPCTTDSCASNACQHAPLSTCEPEDDAGAPPGPMDASVPPDSGSPAQPDSGPTDASVAPDSGSPAQPDSGSSEPDGGGLLVDAGPDAGLGNGGDDGCQCRLSQQRRPVPNMLIAFGLLLALRIGRRRKRS